MLPDGGEPFCHHCDAVRVGDLVFVTGMAAVDADGQVLAPGQAGAQAKSAYAALRSALELVGATPADVVKVTNRLTNVDDRPLVDAGCRELFGEHRPASFTCEVSHLAVDGLLCDVDAVAVVGGAKERLMLPGGDEALGHRSDVVRARNLVWISGMAALGPRQELLAPGDATEQARIAYRRVQACLDLVGGTAADVVMVKNYVTDIGHRPLVNVARQEFFGEHRPASFIGEVPRLGVDGVLYEVECIAVLHEEKQRVMLPGVAEPFSHYCDVVRAGELVFVSGQAAVGLDQRALHPGDPAAQARAAFDGVGRALEAVGATTADVVKVTDYLTDMQDRRLVNGVREQFFGAHVPASSTCEIPALVEPGLVYEVDAIAVVGSGAPA
ncbi:MAG: 2-iminobutanoate/2-iminopropanoate deaminase [Thermoleophilaceae bacterium]|nr:2-iminobutanoate/2-iminopropanoate deaminase [Thermoleophilaceae bacterium]